MRHAAIADLFETNSITTLGPCSAASQASRPAVGALTVPAPRPPARASVAATLRASRLIHRLLSANIGNRGSRPKAEIGRE